MIQTDQQAIRDLIATWHMATALGDLPSILDLMSEDVVFLTAGQPPMRGRDAFAEGFKAATAQGRIESRGAIQEIQVEGNMAYAWSQLEVKFVPSDGSEAKLLVGPTLSVLRKNADGVWQMLRDANLLTPAPTHPS